MSLFLKHSEEEGETKQACFFSIINKLYNVSFLYFRMFWKTSPQKQSKFDLFFSA